MKALRLLIFAVLAFDIAPSYSAEKAPMTLEKLQDQKPFTSWDGHVDPKVVEKSRRVYKTALSKIIALGHGKPESAYAPILGNYIAEFNRLDEEHEFIETLEREDICEQIEEILRILKLPKFKRCDDLPVERNW